MKWSKRVGHFPHPPLSLIVVLFAHQIPIILYHLHGSNNNMCNNKGPGEEFPIEIFYKKKKKKRLLWIVKSCFCKIVRETLIFICGCIPHPPYLAKYSHSSNVFEVETRPKEGFSLSLHSFQRYKMHAMVCYAFKANKKKEWLLYM